MTDKCHDLNRDLETAVSLIKREICFNIILVLLSAAIVGAIVKYAPSFKISLKKEFAMEDLAMIMSFILDLKFLSDLRDAFKKFYKLKRLKEEIARAYPEGDPNTCESQTCYMMKRVLEGVLN